MADKQKWVVPQVLPQVSENEPHEIAEIKTCVRVSREQAEAYKSLPKELQLKLGAPVYGQVLSAEELKKLAREHANGVGSTIMCPW